MLRDATEDLLAFTSFPPGYWKKIWSTEIIESLPGLGSILGAEFLVATGGNLTGFATAGRLASYAGLVPVAQDSGRVTGNLRRPERYNRRLHLVIRGFPSAPPPPRPSATLRGREPSPAP
jgi:hypothetical protein